jgi:hypothetical protein
MANLTQRLNILELTRSRAPAVLQADNNIHDGTEQPTPSKNQTSIVNKKREDISNPRVELPTPSTSTTSSQSSVKPKPRTLKGYIPREKRPNLGAVYIGGILADESDAVIVVSLESYLRDKDIYFRAIRIINHKGNTVAAKIVLRVDDVDVITEKDFWPEGFHVRRWIDKDQ